MTHADTLRALGLRTDWGLRPDYLALIEPHHDATKPKNLTYDPYEVTAEFIARLKGRAP